MSLPKPERRPSARSSSSRSHGNDCHTRTTQLAGLEQPLEHLEGAEPAVLVVDRHHAARRGHAHALAARLDHLVDGRAHVAVAERPGRVLAQDAARLDHAAGHLERRVGALQRRAVQPERVVVLRHQRHGHVRHRAVERLAGRRLGPVALAPAEPAQPAARRHVARAAATTRSSASSSERAPSRRAWRRPSDQVGKCTCESVKPGRTQRSPSSISPAPALSSSTTHGPRTASCPTTGAAGSSVRIVPPVKSTGGNLDEA